MRIKSFSIKILSTILAVALLVSSVFVGGVTFASAEGNPVSNIFTVNTVNDKDYTATCIGDTLKFTPHDDSEVKQEGSKWTVKGQFKYELAINDFEMDFKLLGNATAVEFVFETASYIKTGNKVVTGTGSEEKTTYETTVKNVVRLETDGTLALYVDNVGELSYSLNNGALIALSEKVECNDKTMAKVSFSVEYSQKPTANDGIAFIYIDQSVNDANVDNKQEFKLTNGSLSIKNHVIDLDLDTMGVTMKDGKLYVHKGLEYTFKYKAYKLNNNYLPGSAKLIAIKGPCALNSTERKVLFTQVSDKLDPSTYCQVAIQDAEKNIAVYDVVVLDNETVYKANMTDEQYETALEVNAPKYSSTTQALESFNSKLGDATKAEYEVDGETITASIRVGSSKYLEIPSMESLVSDEGTPYSKLKKTVYYMNVDTDTKFSTYSGMKVPVKTAGTYKFFVIFEDIYGNKLSTDNFFTEENGVVEIQPGLSDYIFTFELEEDAPVSVKAGSQSTWYKGVKNTASSFTIEAPDDKTVEYKLEYKNGNDWVEVKKYTDEAGDYGYFTAKEAEAMAYDGNLTFTPVKTGTYRITCTVSLKNFTATAEAETIIEVKEVTTVKPDDHFFENNIGSFIFLGIGTLALAGVIVLLCIKPKEEN